MSILEILEGHDYRIVEEQFEGHGTVKTIVCNCGDRYGFFETHRKHVAQVLEQHEQEAKAEAVRETSRYLERIFPRKGLVNRADVLADIEIAADRIGRGIHANGRYRNPS